MEGSGKSQFPMEKTVAGKRQDQNTLGTLRMRVGRYGRKEFSYANDLKKKERETNANRGPLRWVGCHRFRRSVSLDCELMQILVYLLGSQ